MDSAQITNQPSFDWLNRHADTIVVISALMGCVLWMNGKFNEIDRRFYEIEKDIAVIKTIMTMKNITTPAVLSKMSEEIGK
jgi:hypothetical protein